MAATEILRGQYLARAADCGRGDRVIATVVVVVVVVGCRQCNGKKSPSDGMHVKG